jgi:DoxX-like protein
LVPAHVAHEVEMLNSALFIAQGLLAGVFTLTGGAKLLLPRETLEKRMHWAASWPRWRIKLLGLAEALGAIGLVVPGAIGIASALTPVAALCLAVLMAGAVATHRRLGERFLPAVIVGALCLLVGVGRSGPPTRASSRHELLKEETRGRTGGVYPP